jgi:hypothetical protein
MRSVISASRRTDIPAFYLKPFMESIRRGFIEISNPFFPKQKRIVSLTYEDVHWIVFWSRNYKHFLKHREFFYDYQLFFHFTILPPSPLEKITLLLPQALRQMELLAQYYGGERIIWRYDPLCHWTQGNEILTNHDIRQFESLCKTISTFQVRRCYISFVHIYQKYRRRFTREWPDKKIVELTLSRRLALAEELKTIAESYNMGIYSCCNSELLQVPGILEGRCIDGNLLNTLDPSQSVSRRKCPTRQGCGCSYTIDVGDYNQQPCYFGCMYCYANPIEK